MVVERTHVGRVRLPGGNAAQSFDVKVPEGCTDPNAGNFDPTARSDDGTCVYDFKNL
jgi:hypothetical protein